MLPICDGDGIYIDFRYFGKVYDEVGEAHDNLLQVIEIGRLLAPIALKQAVSFCFLHEPPRQGLVQRGQRYREVLKYLDARATHTKQDDRSEILIFLSSRE